MRSPVAELSEAGAVYIRWETAGGFHREVRVPGDDLSDLPAEMRDQIEAHWTLERVAEWQARQAAVSNEQPPPTVVSYRTAIQAHLDAVARERHYDSAISCASYLGSTVAQWAEEAAAFVAWRDQVWACALAELDKVTSGARETPDVADFIEALPKMVWPAESA